MPIFLQRGLPYQGLSRLTKLLTKGKSSNITPSKDQSGEPITTTDQLLASWNDFLAKKFEEPQCDANKGLENIVREEEPVKD